MLKISSTETDLLTLQYIETVEKTYKICLIEKLCELKVVRDVHFDSIVIFILMNSHPKCKLKFSLATKRSVAIVIFSSSSSTRKNARLIPLTSKRIEYNPFAHLFHLSISVFETPFVRVELHETKFPENKRCI